MTTMYLHDEHGIFTDAVEVDAMGPLPRRSTHVAPPALSGPEVARRAGSGWEVLPEYPPVTPPAAPAPQEVSRRRGLEALYKMYGVKDVDVEAAITQNVADPGARYLALNEFKASQTFERNRELVVLMGQILNLDLDALFNFAGALP